MEISEGHGCWDVLVFAWSGLGGSPYCSCAVVSRWVMSWRLATEGACTFVENR